MQVDIRVGRPQPAQAWQQPQVLKRNQRTHTHGAITAAAACVIDGSLQLLERGANPRQQRRTFGGQSHQPAVAPEQWLAQIFFERPDLQTRSTGRDPQCVGCTREVQFLGDRNKNAQTA